MSTTCITKTAVPADLRITDGSSGLRTMRRGELASRDVPAAIAAAGNVRRDALAKDASNDSAARQCAAEARGPIDTSRAAYEHPKLEARLALSAGDGLTGNESRVAILERALAAAALNPHVGVLRDAAADLDRAEFSARTPDNALNYLRSRGVDVARSDYAIGLVVTSESGRAAREQAAVPWRRSRDDA